MFGSEDQLQHVKSAIDFLLSLVVGVVEHADSHSKQASSNGSLRRSSCQCSCMASVATKNTLVCLQGRLRPAFGRVLHALQAYAGVMADDKGMAASRRLSAADLLACGESHLALHTMRFGSEISTLGKHASACFRIS